MNEEKKQSLQILIRAYYDYQDERLRLDGQIGRKKNGELKKGVPDRDEALLIGLMKRREEVEAMEDVLFKDIAKEVHQFSLWKEFLINVKGCGETMAAVIMTQFDIHKAPTVSNLWSFAGLATGETFGKKYNKKTQKIVVTDTRIPIDRRTKGFLCPFNQFLRAKLCGVLGSSFLKSNSPYREYYDNMKNRLESEDWGIASKNPVDKKRPKAGHQHKAANRYMIKMFLKDLYIAWRTLEDLPIREPYQVEYLKKRHIA